MSKNKSGTEGCTTIQLEAAIDSLVREKHLIITVQNVLDIVGSPAGDEKDLLRERIVRELGHYEGLIAMIPGEQYAVAGTLFEQKEFLIVPDGFEIENNILIPGHRFVPYMSAELFPSEIEFCEVGARRRQRFREFSGYAENIIKYHLLMGAETLFDFFAAEADENMQTARNSANPMLKLSVLDMEKFYTETNFSEGDALLVKVVDFQQGRFEFRLCEGALRSNKKAVQYRERFEASLTQVTEELLPGTPIIEQIQCALANAPELLKLPAMSLDEMLMSDSIFDIAFDEDGSSLIKRMEDDENEAYCSCDHEHEHGENCSCGGHHHHHHHNDLPENITIGSGETGSLESMLSKLYPLLNMVELDAVLLDNLKNHDFDFNSFYARCFGETALPFVDGMQEACFFNELESRFEEMQEAYPREFDQESGAIRSMIVEFNMERCTLLSELAELSGELEIKTELFEALAEVVLLLDESLKLVNAPAALGEDFDYAQLRSGVEEALETGEEALAALRGVWDGND